MRIKSASLAFCIAASVFASNPASATLISTMPASGDPTGTRGTWASYEWHDLAVGFTVASAGYVTHLDAALQALPQSYGGFVFGIASDALIGTSLNNYFSPAPGSLWETNVCSTGIHPPNFPNNMACSGMQALPGGPTVALAPGEYFSTGLSVYLSEPGTYWLYTRYWADDVFNIWDTNLTTTTTLLATRVGSVTSGILPEHRTFFQTSVATAAPGYSILFEIPEPSTILMGITGIAGLLGLRHRRAHR